MSPHRQSSRTRALIARENGRSRQVSCLAPGKRTEQQEAPLKVMPDGGVADQGGEGRSRPRVRYWYVDVVIRGGLVQLLALGLAHGLAVPLQEREMGAYQAPNPVPASSSGRSLPAG